MTDIPGWKPFLTVDPDKTETSLENCLTDVCKWFNKRGMIENKDYQKVMLPGNIPQFYVLEQLYQSCVDDYVSENRGSAYIERQGIQSSGSRRIIDQTRSPGKRNPGKGKVHD